MIEDIPQTAHVQIPDGMTSRAIVADRKQDRICRWKISKAVWSHDVCNERIDATGSQRKTPFPITCYSEYSLAIREPAMSDSKAQIAAAKD